MPLDSLRELLVEELKDIYNAEKQITKALPKVIRATKNGQLREALSDHLAETEQQIVHLERVFALLGENSGRKKCAAMEGILEEGSELIKEKGAPSVKDAALIGACQAVEHYEIARYGTVATWAELLGLDEVKEILGEILSEEKAADEKLTEIAESVVNEAAALEHGDDEEEAPARKAPARKTPARR
ncbi:ferritin-like domain-containing protein [soil metagenome]